MSESKPIAPECLLSQAEALIRENVKAKSELSATPCSATPNRKEHLISVMRYRLNRAMNYFESGKIAKGKQDVDETIKVLAILESEILCG